MAEYRRQSGTPTSIAHLAGEVGGRARGDAVVESVTADSRAVRPGDLFAALPGAHVHGARFAAAAAERGAGAVMTDSEGVALVEGLGIPLLVVDSPVSALGRAAAAILGEPASQLDAYAITGTNGKTTTAYMLDSILAALGRRSGLIGTVEIRLADTVVPARLTTPMPDELQSYLAFHARAGGTDVVMEASSHALAQRRTDPVRFSVAGFANLTQDHLDFHSSMEEYYRAKASLFTPERCRHAVVNVDGRWGRRLLAEAAGRLPGTVAALAVEGPCGDLPDGVVGWTVTRTGGPDFTLESADGRRFATSTSLPGRFNVANAALASAMALTAGYAPDDLARALPDGVSPVVPGRMETISDRPRVVVDFAHNTGALVEAMRALRPSTAGRLIVLTGSAGQRDAGKRPAMGEAVATHADLVYITDDDPHDEDPAAIRREVIAGALGHGTPVVEIANRAEAIARCIREAENGDTILLAGRGHETVQEVAGVPIELDDRAEARRALRTRAVEEMRA